MGIIDRINKITGMERLQKNVRSSYVRGQKQETRQNKSEIKQLKQDFKGIQNRNKIINRLEKQQNIIAKLREAKFRDTAAGRFSQGVKRAQQRVERFARSPGYTAARVQTVKTIRRIVTPQGRVVRQRVGPGGRGRPVGTFKYFIPGVGRVGVYQWRKYIRAQRNIVKSRYAQAAAIQSAQYQAQRQYPGQPVQVNQQYIPQQVQQPQYPQQFQQPVRQLPAEMFQEQGLPVVQPSLKEISIMERNAFNLGINPQEAFVERNLMSGAPVQRRIGHLL